MQITASPVKTKRRPKTVSTKAYTQPAFATAEIYAYIAIRDELLAEAEELKTRAKIDGLMVANDFVSGCLKPVHPPYQAQSLSEMEAARERKRCDSVRDRIEQLRANAI
ncbi:MAG TPA: hypothetical protein VEI58_06395 [Chthoniobacterales bacterium]|nr:hypothetical protein [Chthoniobacterales bacterium]